MNSIAWILLFFIMFLALVFFLISPAGFRPATFHFTNRMYAHRGLHNLRKGIPENSLPAFAAAKKKNFGVELDVQLSKDGKVIVFHDRTLERMCGSDKEICTLTYPELQAYSLAGTAEKIPLLSEALETLDGVPVICEIKTGKDVRDVDAICEKTERILRTHTGIYCVESFSPFVLGWFRRNAPQIIRGQLSEAYRGKTIHEFFMKHLLVNAISRPDFIAYNFRSIKPLGFRLVHLLRPGMFAWTVKNEEELETAQKAFDSFIFEDFYND